MRNALVSNGLRECTTVREEELPVQSFAGLSCVHLSPKGPCTQIVYTLALKYLSIYIYIYIGTTLRPMYIRTTWAHGPLGFELAQDLFGACG